MSFEKKIFGIRQLIKESENPIMFFDTDADGCTSYFQLKKVFPQIKGFYMRKEGQAELIENIKKNTDLIIIFDIPFLTEDFLEKTKEKKIIWVDHHPLNQEKNIQDLLKKYDIVHLNPLDYDENDNRPSSYMAYLVADKKENLPLACLGSVADFFVLDILNELYKYDRKSFEILFNIAEDKRDKLFGFLKKYKFNDPKKIDERSYWVRYLTYECGFIDFKNLFDLLFKLDEKEDNKIIGKAITILEKMDITEMSTNINSGKGFLFEDLALMKKKYLKILKKILEKQENEEFIFIEYTGKSSFTRQIAEELTYKFPDFKVICIIFKPLGKEYLSGSFRGNGFDVNSLVSNAIKGLDGNGGGHQFSAGCRINKKDYKIFKDRILEIFDSKKN